ncbi:MAG: hypothetical protein EP343_17390 [Deltaproteobacteria bacterium]|nr:MAG: hypothetical protein EP343_17390 [Deltaproteobacteria bacterium]
MRKVLLVWITFLLVGYSVGCTATFPESNENYSPYFPPTIPDPKLKIVTINKSSDPNGMTRFGLKRVDDQNHTDVLYAYWFLGHEHDNTQSLRVVQNSPPPSQPVGATSPTTVRNAEFYLEVKHNDPLFEKHKSVVLELYVVDREADQSKLKGQVEHTWPDGAKWQKHTWTLKVD